MYLAMNNASSWPGSGTTITDLSGNGYNGTIIGSATHTSTSVSSVSGGSPGAITTGYNLPSSNWTVRVIANVSTTQTYWATIWGNESYTSNFGFLAYCPLATSINFGSPTSGSLSYSSSGFEGTTLQYDFTFDGTNYKIYINGVLESTSGNYTAPTVATDGLYFGSRHQNGGGATNTDYSNTTYYMMQVYNVAQTAPTILAAYNTNKPIYGI
jgi:hypothetical protein